MRPQESADAALRPPSLKNLLEVHIAKLKGVVAPVPSMQARRMEMEKIEADSLTSMAAAAAETVPPTASASAAYRIIDDLAIKSLPALAKQLGRNSDETAPAHAERVGAALEGFLGGARRLASTACGLGTRKTDFAEANWPKARIEKLCASAKDRNIGPTAPRTRSIRVLQTADEMCVLPNADADHLCVFLATRGETFERIATTAQRQADLQGKLEVGAANAALSRFRHRLNENESAPEKQGPSMSRRREIAAVQEAFALREVAAAYERLLRGMHATLSTLGTYHVALASRFDESEVLHSGPSPLAAASWIESSVRSYAHALERCAVASSPPLNLFEAGAGDGSAPPGMEGGSPLSPASIDQLLARVAAALGEAPPASTSAISASAVFSPKYSAHSPTLLSSSASRRPTRWPTSSTDGGSTKAGTGTAPTQAFYPSSSSAVRQASSGVICELLFGARTLRLRGNAADRVQGEMLRLTFKLLPASLRLPSLSTPTTMVRGTETQLGYDDKLTFSSGE